MYSTNEVITNDPSLNSLSEWADSCHFISGSATLSWQHLDMNGNSIPAVARQDTEVWPSERV